MSKIKSEFIFLNEKIDKIDGRLDSIEKIQDGQAQDLKIHVERTNELQKMVLPLYKMYIWLNYNLKAIAILAALGGCFWIYKLIISLL